MFFKYVLGIDPSGEFTKGKGTTGWCLIDEACNILEHGSIYSRDHSSAEDYWIAVLKKIKEIHKNYKNNVHTVIEDYIIYPNMLEAHALNRAETCRLLGCIQSYLYSEGRSFKLQQASRVKHRWTNPILVKKGILRKDIKMNGHEIDALRHAVHQHYIERHIIKQQELKKKQKYVIKEFKSYE